MIVIVTGYPTFNPRIHAVLYRGLHDPNDMWDIRLVQRIVEYFIGKGWEVTIILTDEQLRYEL